MTTLFKNISIFIFVLLSLFILSCGGGKQNEKEQAKEEHHEESIVELTEAQYKNAAIVTGKIERRNLSGTIKVNGMLDVPPQSLVTISVPYGGTIKQTDLLQGMKVSKGQVIAVLEHPDYIQLQQDYLDAGSKLKYMELELKRQEELQKGNVNSAKVYQQTVSDYESLKNNVNGLEIKLSMLNINSDQIRQNGIQRQIKLLAPISGYVTEVNVNVGSYINQNEIICKIVDTRHLHAELTVFEKDITSLKIGQKVRFNLNNENTERTATIFLIGREIVADRTIRVHCHLDKEDQNLLPGMYLEAYIETQSKGVPVISTKAVVQSEGKNYVFVSKGKQIEEGKTIYVFEKREVSVGIKNNGFMEITFLKGSDGNEEIVTEGAYDLLSKMGVQEEEGHSH
jgi:cobalt-zinc-cadmium efflux system membrane fusion protein